MSNVEILEEKLKERLLDPRIYCTMSGSNKDCFKIGYWCGAADALEETRTKCTEEVMEDHETPVKIERNSDGVYVPTDDDDVAFGPKANEYSELFDKFKKASDRVADLEKTVASLQKKNLDLQKEVSNIKRTRDALLHDFSEAERNCDEAEQKYRNIAEYVEEMDRVLDKIDISSIQRFMNLARNAVLSDGVDLMTSREEDLDI